MELNVPWDINLTLYMSIPKYVEDRLPWKEGDDRPCTEPNWNREVCEEEMTHRPSARTEVNAYVDRRDACTSDGRNAAGSAYCLTDWEAPLKYGWYCGKDRPLDRENPDGSLIRGTAMKAMELDPVDYCCRLHDKNLFDDREFPLLGKPNSLSPINACGFVMCLASARAWPRDPATYFPQVERARQKMYNWSKALCPGIQPPNPPRATLGPPPG
jgi:hypothetical protein